MKIGKATILKAVKHKFKKDCDMGRLTFGDMTKSGQPSLQYKKSFKETMLQKTPSELQTNLAYIFDDADTIIRFFETPGKVLKKLIKEAL